MKGQCAVVLQRRGPAHDVRLVGPDVDSQVERPGSGGQPTQHDVAAERGGTSLVRIAHRQVLAGTADARRRVNGTGTRDQGRVCGQIDLITKALITHGGDVAAEHRRAAGVGGETGKRKDTPHRTTEGRGAGAVDRQPFSAVDKPAKADISARFQHGGAGQGGVGRVVLEAGGVDRATQIDLAEARQVGEPGKAAANRGGRRKVQRQVLAVAGDALAEGGGVAGERRRAGQRDAGGVVLVDVGRDIGGDVDVRQGCQRGNVRKAVEGDAAAGEVQCQAVVATGNTIGKAGGAALQA